MKTLFAALTVAILSSTAFAGVNLFDQVYSDCTDYGHSKISDQEKQACIAEAKASVLAVKEYSQQFLDCIDYGHSEVSPEKEIQCLKEVSQN